MLFPTADRLIPRAEKELRLGQRACVLWLTGLSGSGKSTLALALEARLFALGYHSVLLDGDNIRTGINSNLGFSNEDRMENIRRMAEVAKLFVSQGIICLVSFISPTKEMRGMAREIIGEKDFVEIFIDTPLEECEARDVKGLYKKARAGEITDFTGISAPYEAPEQPDIHIRTTGQTVAESGDALWQEVMSRVHWRL